MNESDPKLLEALRAVAAEGPQGAPVHVEERLLAELRRRSRVHRRNVRLAALAGAIAAGIAVMLWIRPTPVVPAGTVARLQASATTSQVAEVLSPNPLKASSAAQDFIQDDESATNFYDLPDTDDLPPLESAIIVRLQMPMSSLRLIGLPVSEERAAEAIQADVLLGQDGLARGVRLVE